MMEKDYAAKQETENMDFSKRVLEISIESEVFSGMLRDINLEIQRCIHQVYEEKFESGEINLKLTIELPEAHENYPVIDEGGEASILEFKYRKPVFGHKVTTTLKKQYKRDGGYCDKRDIQLKDGRFIAIPIEDPQVAIDEL